MRQRLHDYPTSARTVLGNHPVIAAAGFFWFRFFDFHAAILSSTRRGEVAIDGDCPTVLQRRDSKPVVSELWRQAHRRGIPVFSDPHESLAGWTAELQPSSLNQIGLLDERAPAFAHRADRDWRRERGGCYDCGRRESEQRASPLALCLVRGALRYD
jgi:hypothetical protein